MKGITGIIISNTLFKSTVFITIVFLLCHNGIIAQDKSPIIFGKVLPADFDLPINKIIDSGTNAVIISNVGAVDFVGNKTNNWLSYVLKKSTRIKIINKKAFNFATIQLKLFGSNGTQDKLDDLQASTYNLENGIVSEKKLSTSDIFEERINRGLIEKKFTMPDLKEGSIIEYSYTITSRRYYALPGWAFQNQEIPCLYSEFQVTIPDLLRYVTERHGIDSFNVVKSVDSYSKIAMATVNVGTSMHTHTWIMKDIAPIKIEKFIYAPSDYIDKIEFHLAQTYNGEDINNIMIDWNNASEQLMKRKDFGTAILVENTANLQNTMEKACAGTANLLDASKSIYNYVRDNFTCIPNNYIYLGQDLYEVNKAKKGNVADLNLLLIALLRQKGLKADPVILSTREYGTHPTNFPVLEKMNYVICLLQLYGDTIYLDASHPQLAFGKLPLSCYNGHAQVINEKYGGSIFLYADGISQPRSTSVFLYNNDNGDSTIGTFQFNPSNFESYDIRNTIKGEGEKEYFSKIKFVYGNDFEINNTKIDALEQLEMPVTINYDLGLKLSCDDDLIYFSPILYNGFRENPFKSEDRKFPIEMVYPLDDLYVLNMEIPKNYMVDELPKSAKIAFNGNDGLFEYIISKDATKVQLRCHVKLKHCLFEADDYNALRDFFTYVVKKESEQIVFKKIK